MCDEGSSLVRLFKQILDFEFETSTELSNETNYESAELPVEFDNLATRTVNKYFANMMIDFIRLKSYHVTINFS